MAASIPDLPNRFSSPEIIGHGSVGSVYAARDEVLGQKVALKTVRDPGSNDRDLYREFRIASAIAHPNLVQLFELIRYEDVAIVVMDFIAGGENPGPGFERWNTFSGSERDLERIVKGLCSGLDYLHSRGIRHGDIKPQNIIITPGSKPVIVDYGLARAISDEKQRFFAGTWRYAAPEQFSGASDEAADWFSLGVVLYEYLAGKHPFGDDDPASILHRKMNAQYDRCLTTRLADLIYDMLQPDPGKRLEDMRATLLHFCDQRLFMATRREAPSLSSLISGPFERSMTAERLHVTRLLGNSGSGKSARIDALAGALPADIPLVVGRADPREAIPLNLFDRLFDRLDIDTNLPGQALRETLLEQLRAAAGQTRVVIVFEDLQWADADSVHMLRWLLPSLEHLNISLIVTARPDLWKQCDGYAVLNTLNGSPVSSQETVILEDTTSAPCEEDRPDSPLLTLFDNALEPLSINEIRTVTGFEHIDVVEVYYLLNQHVLVHSQRGEQPVFSLADRWRRAPDRAIHRALAEMYVERSKDPGIAVRHFELGGLDDAAGRFSRTAAVHYWQRGLVAAAANYASKALLQQMPASEALALQQILADSLARSGRPARAAEVYLTAAAAASGAQQRHLRLKAAESFFVAGNLEKGLELSAELLEALSIFPHRYAGHSEMMEELSALDKLAPLREISDTGQLEEAWQVCWTVAVNTVHLQPARAFAHLSVAIRIARALDDSVRFAQGLALAGGGVFSGDSRFRRQQAKYLDIAASVAAETLDPCLAASEQMWRAHHVFQAGEWNKAARLLRKATKQFRQLDRPTLWEEMTAGSLYAACLLQRGMLRYLRTFSDKWISTAEENGHLYGQVTFRQMKAFHNIVIGDTGNARAEIEWMRSHWTRRQTVVHFYLDYFEAFCSLVDGDLPAVASFLETHLPAFEAMGGYRGSTPAMHMLLLEGAFRFLCRREGIDPAAGHSLEQMLQLLEDVPRADAPALATLLRGLEKLHNSEMRAGKALVVEAKQAFRALNMQLFTGLIDYGLAPPSHRSVAAAQLARLGVVDAAITAPAFLPVPDTVTGEAES